MASAIKTTFGEGGANLAPGGGAGSPTASEALRDGADDLAELRASVIDLRTKFASLLTKLDADAGVTDVNYASTLALAAAPAALKLTKAST